MRVKLWTLSGLDRAIKQTKTEKFCTLKLAYWNTVLGIFLVSATMNFRKFLYYSLIKEDPLNSFKQKKSNNDEENVTTNMTEYQ